jgi:hypothetical protein
MALVAAANGVDSLIIGQGISIIDEGRGEFKIGLNVISETTDISVIFAAPYPLGVSDVILPPPFIPDYLGIYLLSVYFNVNTDEATPIIAGPDDRAVFCILDASDELVASIPFKIYNTPAGGDAQVSILTSIVTVKAGESYNVVLRVYNMSGTLSAPDGNVAYSLFPLTSSRVAQEPPAPDPGPPGPGPALAAMPVVPLVASRNVFIRKNGFTHRRLDIPR